MKTGIYNIDLLKYKVYLFLLFKQVYLFKAVWFDIRFLKLIVSIKHLPHFCIL
jgi:hypothetical protein